MAPNHHVTPIPFSNPSSALCRWALSQTIGRALVDLGITNDPEPTSFTKEEIEKYYGGVSNMLHTPRRAQSATDTLISHRRAITLDPTADVEPTIPVPSDGGPRRTLPISLSAFMKKSSTRWKSRSNRLILYDHENRCQNEAYPVATCSARRIRRCAHCSSHVRHKVHHLVAKVGLGDHSKRYWLNRH